MEGDNMNMILIGNTTFTFTEDSHGLNSKESCQEVKSNYPVDDDGVIENPAYLPFQTITITSVQPHQNDLTNVEAHPQQPLPYVFDNNFVQYNYFNRDYSNLTVYVHDPNLLPPPINSQQHHNRECCFSDNIENYPFFSSNNPIDFPFMDRTKIEEGIHYLTKDESDSPEFIDINALMIPREYQNCLTLDKPTTVTTSQPFAVPSFLKRNRKRNSKQFKSLKEDDDDVIFVGEYKKFEKKDESKVYPEPRRNPKRQVQLQKISYELAEKMSMDDYFENNAYCKKEYYMANTKRSARNTGAVFSPPDSLTIEDFKKWPADGMHERPSYNPVTKKLEKNALIVKKPKLKIQKSTTHNRRKIPNRRRKPRNVSDECEKEFGKVAHQMLHYVLSYIEQVKQCNKILGVSPEDSDRNLKHTEELLQNTSALYCLATDTSQENLAQYLHTVNDRDNVAGFLISVVEEFEK